MNLLNRPQRRSAHRRCTGFSTTQLLVLLLVIAVLAILAFIYFGQKQAAAAQSTTVNNLRNWGIAYNMYLLDNTNWLPQPGTSDEIEDNGRAWYNALPPYLAKPPLGDLPISALPRPGKPSLWINPAAKEPPKTDERYILFHYGMNAWLAGRTGRGMQIYDIRNPHAVVLFGETEGYEPSIISEDVVSHFGKGGPYSPEAMAHFVFASGHVQVVRRSTFTSDAASNAEEPAEDFTWVPYPGAKEP